MSLQNCKQYDTRLNARDLGDKSDERINRTTPHQAPQRARVSSTTRTRRPRSSSAAAGSRQSPGRQRGWKDYINPSINMGVPTLMMILEPNIVWGHAHGYCTGGTSSSRGTGAASCQAYFFDGLDQLSRPSHGVYEGNYWQLLGDMRELEDMLARMTRAPALLQVPTLELPPQLDLPKWEQFKPELLPLPEAPAAGAAPVLPDFAEPHLPLTTQVPAPELLLVPPLPPPWKEVIAAEPVPPAAPKPVPLQLPELLLPVVPVLKEPAKPAGYGPPQYGHDWSGNRPFQVPVPSYTPPNFPPEPVEVPDQLPAPELQEAQLELMPVPIAVLGWQGVPEEGAPEQDPQDVDGVPLPVSHAGTAAPGSAAGSDKLVGSASRAKGLASDKLRDAWKEVQLASPVSAGTPVVWLDFKPPYAEPPPVLLPPRPEPGPEPQLQAPVDLQDLPSFKPPVPQCMPEYVEPPLVLPSWAAPCEPLPVGFLRGSAPVLIMDVSGTMHPARRGQFLRVKKCVCELLEPQGELSTAGTAFDVLAFSGSCWSWSAAHTGRQALVASALLGSYLSPNRQAGRRQSGQLQQHASPVSRTRTHWQRQQLQQQWQQRQEQATLAGELPGSRPGTAAGTSAAGLITAQAAGTIPADNLRPATAEPVIHKAQGTHLGVPRHWQLQQQGDGPVLQPTDAEHLLEAQAWVRNWPEAVGSTNLLTALKNAHQYTHSTSGSPFSSPRASTGAHAAATAAVMDHDSSLSSVAVDCYYLFSDGLADDTAACLEWVQQQAEAGTALRPVHTVGFFPRNGCTAGERFLSQLAAATGGTFQVYSADLPVPATAAAILRNAGRNTKQLVSQVSTAEVPAEAAVGAPKAWDSALGAFVAVDLEAEDAAVRSERHWAADQLKRRRMDNKRLGRCESLTVMLEAVRQQHQKERVLSAMEHHQQKLLQSKAVHTAACAAVARANDAALQQAQRVHAVAVQMVQDENQRRVMAAQRAHELAVDQWQQQYAEALQAWEQAVAEAKSIAAAAATAAVAEAQGITSQQMPTPCAATDIEQQQKVAVGSSQFDSSQLYTGSSTDSNSPQPLEADGGKGNSCSRVSFSSNSSFLGPDPSLAADAGWANCAVGPCSGSGQLQVPTAAEAPSDEASFDVLFSGRVAVAADCSSAKLTFPLPALPDTHSHRSLSSWGGTPRLPDAANANLSNKRGQQPEIAACDRKPGTAGSRCSKPVSAGSAGRGRPRPASAGAADCGLVGPVRPKSANAAAFGHGSASSAKGSGPVATAGRLTANSRPKSATGCWGATRPSRGTSISSAGSRQKVKHSSSSNLTCSAENSSADQQAGQQQQHMSDSVQKMGNNRPRSTTASHRRAISAAELKSPHTSGSGAAAAAVQEGVDRHMHAGDPMVHLSNSNIYLGTQELGVGSRTSWHNEGPRQQVAGPKHCYSDGGKGHQLQSLAQDKLLLQIQSITAANREALEHIYEDWHSQVVQVERHNNSTLQLHEKQSMLHATQHVAYLRQHKAWEEQVQQLKRQAQQDCDSAAAHAVAENARLAHLHQHEVAEKVARDAAYAQAMSDYTAAHSALLQQHQAAVAAAKAAHEAAVAAAKEHWQRQQCELEQEYQQQLKAVMQQHTELVQQTREQNKLARDAHKAASEAYRAATLENKRRLVLYEEMQKAAIEKLAAANQVALQQARQDYKVLCAQLVQLHQQQQEAAQADWLAAKAAVQESNELALAAARARYAAAVDEMMQQHQAACDQLTQQHADKLAGINSRNDELMPQVIVARLAAAELARVKLFAAHMRSCAAKLQLGVNFLADTPNLDRVVEMSALIGALKAAFPDIPQPRHYPWPVGDFNAMQRPQGLESAPASAQLNACDTAASGTRVAVAGVVGRTPTTGDVAPVSWGRCRPSTAPPVAARPVSAVVSCATSTCSPGSLQRGKGGWRAKSPSTVHLRSSLQDPALLLKQLQQHGSSQTSRLRSSGCAGAACTPACSSAATGGKSVGSAVRARTVWPQQQQVSNEDFAGRQLLRQQQPTPSPSAGCATQPCLWSSCQHSKYSLISQRPLTAPACDTTSSRLLSRARLGSKMRSSCHDYEEHDAVEGGRLQTAMQFQSAVAGRSIAKRARADLPARHAVEHSAAGQKMAQVLVLHHQRLSGKH